MALGAACAGGGALPPSLTSRPPVGTFGMWSDVAYEMQNQNMSRAGCYLWHEQKRKVGKAKQFMLSLKREQEEPGNCNCLARWLSPEIVL